MKNLIVVLVSLISTSALADGWQCRATDGTLNVAVYNQTSQGTRTASILVVSDPRVQAGRKTIATFKRTDSELTSSGALYTAYNSTSFGDEGGGEYIAGTRLGYVSKLVLGVAFSYNNPVEAGALVQGLLSVVKEDGQRTSKNLVCARYLKGEAN